MKKILLLLILGLSGWVQAAAIGADAIAPPDLQPTQLEVKAAHMAADILSRYHYRAIPLDQALSEKIFDRYLKSLDSEKAFCLQADVDRFSGVRDRMGPAIRQDDLSVPFAIFNLFDQRVAQRYQHARELLKHGFDFQMDERFQMSRETQVWPQTASEMDELWRKRVKSEWLSLKLAGRDDQSIVQTLDKRYALALKRMSQTTSADAFQTFMNAYTMSIEPHTNYMGPRAAEEFDISMRLSLVGIGAAIFSADDTATITELTAGSPAALSRQLKIGDRIVGVAQGATGEMVDVVGWRPDDLIALIRGPADTVVRLAVLPADAVDAASQKVVSLVRKPVDLEDDAAKSSIETISDGATSRRVGVITLPSFYEDFAGKQAGDPDFKNATRDVQKLLTEFNTHHVDAVLVDLRGNGGGSLTQAIELSSLFLGNVPVVQQRNAAGDVLIGVDTQASVVWHGPLGVLIDKRSASASEIFAAAIQDYGRGVIIGQSSYGKGTVQSMIDLDELANSVKPQLGELKMTVAQFFRVTGGTTQLKGVVPDIGFASISDEAMPGESGFDNALPWTRIKALYYSPNVTIKSIIPILAEKHALRIKRDTDFKNLQADVDAFKQQRTVNEISLNETERRKERMALQARLTARLAPDNPGKSGPSDVAQATSTRLGDGLLPGERSVTDQLRVEKSLKSMKDIVLIEAQRIMIDAIGLLRPMHTWS